VNRSPHETYAHVAGVVYVALATNAALAVALSPLLFVLVVVPDVAAGWPVLVLLVGMVGAPALAATAAVFHAASVDGSTAAFRAFARAWVRTAPRAVPLGAVAGAVLVVVGVDAVALRGTSWGALTLPLLMVLALLVVAVSVLGTVALAERPDVRLRQVLRASLWLAIRRWPFTLVSLGVLLVLGAAIVLRPALGVGLAASPLLYLVWVNSRWSLRLLDTGSHRSPHPVLPGRQAS
jgi:uncharacterized membrane protein YesL